MTTSNAHSDTAPAEETPAALVGRTIRERYRIEALLGSGGMGSVYRATQLDADKTVAVKVLSRKMSQNPKIVARFEREAKAAGSFGHPHVAASTEYGRMEDGRFFLAMEYVKGRELRAAIDEIGPLPPVRALFIARQIASALSRAHKLGIVHRDLKPENIMLVRHEGQDDFVKVLDFGLALVSKPLNPDEQAEQHIVTTAPKITQVGEIFGTPSYMAPEQTGGELTDIRTDLYALGILLYEMLTGLRPFVGKNTIAIIQQQLATPPPPMRERAPNVQIPDDIEAMVRRLLAKLPEERFQTPEDLIKTLDQLGATHNLAWPGSASASNPAVSGAVKKTEENAGLMLQLQNLRARVSNLFSKRPPKSALGQALDAIQRKLDGKARRARQRRFMMIGAAVVALLILAILWSVFRKPVESPSSVAPQESASEEKQPEPPKPSETRRDRTGRQRSQR